MKKFFIFLITIAIGGFAKSQTSGAVVTTIPSSFTAEDVVKIIIDVSNVPNLRDKEPLYLWTWEPSEPSPGNGSWDNSNEGRKLTKEGPNKWSLTITPSTFYGKSPAEIKQISFLVKAKNGNGDLKTDDIHLSVAPLVYVPSVLRTFPKIVGQNELINVFLDQSLSSDISTQRMTPSLAKVTLWSTSGAQVDAEKTFALSASGKLYTFSFLPSKSFTIPNGVTVAKMRVIFRGKMKDANGNDVDVDSPAFEYGFDDLK